MPRMGRPKSDNPKVKQLGVRLDKDMLDKLDALTEHYKETRVEVLRRGINLLYSAIKK